MLQMDRVFLVMLHWVGAAGCLQKEGLEDKSTPRLALSEHFAPPLTNVAAPSQP